MAPGATAPIVGDAVDASVSHLGRQPMSFPLDARNEDCEGETDVGGELHIDGNVLGRWITQHLAQTLNAPSTGIAREPVPYYQY